MDKFNEWLAEKLANTLGSMGFFYVCVLLDLIELPPVIQSGSVIIWCTYVSQTVIQLIALPILSVQQKNQDKHHKQTHAHLETIIKHHKIKTRNKA